MPNSTEYILKPDGAFFARNIEEQEIRVTPDMLSSVTSNVRLAIPAAFRMPPESRPVGLTVKGGAIFTATIHLDKLVFNSPFVLRNEVLYPEFASNSAPVMTMEWVPPESMKLVLVARMTYSGNEWRHAKVWLFAFGEKGQGWKLPVSNLYDDCSVCTGDTVSRAPSLQESLTKIYLQFRNARWNKDLFYDTDKAVRMFRWKPETTPFEQLSIDAPNWTNLCTKVSSPIMEEICH